MDSEDHEFLKIRGESHRVESGFPHVARSCSGKLLLSLPDCSMHGLCSSALYHYGQNTQEN